ncbi:histidine kinase [Microbacterium sp. W1N]|uniref:sensor histidine kinase n=1 Tax=Microbacterium festucae TaxID=2977531 RepID=UPI0021BE92F9|nr:histidine kinase [Microbacterium festucae]MCT9819289.1 histidine kinase [Microbacterium festucae]
MSTLLGTRRAASSFALTVFVVTAVQVLSVPAMAYFDGMTEWGLALPEPAIVVLLVLGCAVQAWALTLSDRWPRWAVAIATTTYVTLAIGLGVPSWLVGMYLVIALALFLLATRVRVVAASLWAVGVIVTSMGALFAWLLWLGSDPSVATSFVLGETARLAAPATGATALGIWWAVRVRRVTAVQQQAELAEQEHARRVSDAQRSERARIAQELHDVAGQHLAGLVTLADAAVAISPDQPEQALALLEDVRSEGRFAAASLSGALADMRAVDSAPRQSTPDLRRAEELFVYWRRVGMAVSASVEGDVEDLPAVVSSTAYRAMQEALTNAAKHAPGAVVEVMVIATSSDLELMVSNTDRDASALPRVGLDLRWGLAGMRERVELLGGTLDAGPCSNGGWRVTLKIPITPVA